MFDSRPYQAWMEREIDAAWSRGGLPLAVLPTGGGKTHVFARVIRDAGVPAATIAHRRELVGQMSLALARDEIEHRIIAPEEVVRAIVRNNIEELGYSCYAPTAPTAAVSVDSIARAPAVWRKNVKVWVMDEGHHVLEENKWGRAVRMFPNARGLGVTATPMRADGRGLGAHADGLYTELIIGPSMRDLIDQGYLCDYKIYAPKSRGLDLSEVARSRATGDYMAPQLREAVAKAHITGDVVSHYKKLAAGKLGVTFAVDVERAHEIADAFRAAGVPALAVHAKTPHAERTSAIRRFARREILQLVNVDLFGEGFDLPAIEVVSFARPTHSFPLYAQAFGRALRPMEGKQYAIVIDHVGNVTERHGPPDAPREYTLDSRNRSTSDSGTLSVKACAECAGVYERVRVSCPYCGATPVPAQRSAPEFVDGDLTELSPEALEELRAAVARVDLPKDEYARMLARKGCPPIGVSANVKRHEATQAAQARLRCAMEWWRGVKEKDGLTERESYRSFYLEFGVDAMTARSLSQKDADRLYERIRSSLPFAVQCMT